MDGVDSILRQHLARLREVDIGGGEAEGVSNTTTVENDAGDGKGASEQGGRLFHPSLGETLADAARTDGLSIHQEWLATPQLEAQLRSQERQSLKVVVVPASESAVITKEQAPHLHPIIHPPRHLAGRHLRHFPRER